MIKFVFDSSCDFPEIGKDRLTKVPMVISTDERNFVDDEHLNITEMLDYLADYKGRSYTACPSVDSWMSAFEGADEIYACTITSGLSGSYNSAIAARELFLHEHPGVKIAVFDSLSTGPELGILLEKLVALIDSGLPFEEVEAQARAYQNKTRLFFSLQSLHNLSQNGRVSKVVAKAVGMLSIRIVGTASTEGTLETQAKSRGDKRALDEIIQQAVKAGYRGGKMRIAHVENPGLAKQLADLVKGYWPESDVSLGRCGGLCSFYAERGGLLVAVETE